MFLYDVIVGKMHSIALHQQPHSHIVLAKWKKRNLPDQENRQSTHGA